MNPQQHLQKAQSPEQMEEKQWETPEEKQNHLNRRIILGQTWFPSLDDKKSHGEMILNPPAMFASDFIESYNWRSISQTGEGCFSSSLLSLLYSLKSFSLLTSWKSFSSSAPTRLTSLTKCTSRE